MSASGSTVPVAKIALKGKFRKSWKGKRVGKSTGAQLAALKKKVNRLAVLDAPETKAYYNTVTGSSSIGYANSYSLQSASSIAQGDTLSGRLGSKIRGKQIRIRMNIFGQNAVGGHASVNCRLFMVQYDQPASGTVMYPSDFLQTSTTTASLTAPPWLYSTYNYKVLIDETFNVGSNYLVTNDAQVFIERVVDLKNKVMEYDSNSTVPAAKGQIGWWVFSDDSTLGTASLSMSAITELLYTDA